jgi:hypothetical protein
MAEQDPLNTPFQIPYADVHTPPGITGFCSYEYPQDRICFWNPARLIDDGNIIQLRPASLVPRLVALSLASAALMIAVYFADTNASPRPAAAQVVAALVLFGAGPVLLLILPGLFVHFERKPQPWIEIDRERQQILFPRDQKTISFAQVIRLQCVEFDRVGSPRYLFWHRPNGLSGEVQIVFIEDTDERTRCIVAKPDPSLLLAFASRFHRATAIPVSSVRFLLNGHWKADPFPGI